MNNDHSSRGAPKNAPLPDDIEQNKQPEDPAAKTSLQKVSATDVVRTNGHKPSVASPELKLIPITDLELSKTNPRRRIIEETILSLAESIMTHGILEPLIVRKGDKKYEIVCGERRFRAASVADMPELPCLVRDLTDERVLDIQIHENLHREDVHPMDEAYGYQFLKEKLNCDITELALRVGKSEGYVLNRLKLHWLIEEAQKDLDDELLPLVYALEIAKYSPEIQQVIYGEVYKKEGKYKGDKYVYTPLKGQTVPLKSLLEWINTNIHHSISSAPFNAKATDLRTDGLACINCPDRTGAAASLFEPNQIGKKDACLNPACYKQKAENHVVILRQKLADQGEVDPSEVPLIRSWSYSDGADYLGSVSATVISGAKRGNGAKNCKKAISGIDIEPDNYGKAVQVCLKTSGCKIHWKERTNSSAADSVNGKSTEEDAAEQTEARRARREEIWNAKIAEAVRVRVFKQAAEEFEKKFAITSVGTEFVPQLIAKFWRMTSSGDANNLRSVVKSLLNEWLPESGELYVSESRSGIETIKGLKQTVQFRILFLLTHGHKGTLGFNNSYSSQAEVRALAKEFKVDYSLIDAEARLEFSPKKHLEVHQSYLEAVTAKKKDAEVPRLFCETWKPRD